MPSWQERVNPATRRGDRAGSPTWGIWPAALGCEPSSFEAKPAFASGNPPKKGSLPGEAHRIRASVTVSPPRAPRKSSPPTERLPEETHFGPRASSLCSSWKLTESCGNPRRHWLPVCLIVFKVLIGFIFKRTTQCRVPHKIKKSKPEPPGIAKFALLRDRPGNRLYDSFARKSLPQLHASPANLSEKPLEVIKRESRMSPCALPFDELGARLRATPCESRFWLIADPFLGHPDIFKSDPVDPPLRGSTATATTFFAPWEGSSLPLAV